ncbi:MAG: hypothetical protein HZA77_02225 [Candidatus Schekmanbacteria bacterium]|nr:hypothetical protein [Candidatus Schekmanbacteria bacterium]
MSKGNDKYVSTLVENFNNLEKIFIEKYLPNFPIDNGSHTGLPHIKNIEAGINTCLEIQENLHLSFAESYVLLTALTLHDIGKIKQVDSTDNKHSENGIIQQMLSRIDKDRANVSKWWIKRSKNKLIESNKGSKAHSLLSALTILETPAKFSIFDAGLSDCIARVCLLHNHNNRKIADRHGWLSNVYLDSYGTIHIEWLGALLCLADELDTSYHRKVEIGFGPEGSKGDVRGLISGCELDLVGRNLLMYPTPEFLSLLAKGEKNEKLYWIYNDIIEKERVFESWGKELKQMGLELRSCTILVDNNLITTKRQTLRNQDQQNTTPYDFMLTIEPNITPLKVDRVLEAMFKLRLGVLGKVSFTWEVLASEAGIEKIDEVKRIFHRIASLSNDIYFKVHIPFKRSGMIRLNNKIYFDELDGQWSIKLSKIETKQYLAKVKNEICQRFAYIIDTLKERVQKN